MAATTERRNRLVETTPSTSDLAQRKPTPGRLTREQKMGRSKTTNKPGYLALSRLCGKRDVVGTLLPCS